jgi:hypothetical protein
LISVTTFTIVWIVDDLLLWFPQEDLLAKIQRLFSRDLALENDYLRQENKILSSKQDARVPLTEAERRVLVKYGLRIRNRLGEVISIAKPETLLTWHRRQKQQKWTFDNQPKAPGRPRKSEDSGALMVRFDFGRLDRDSEKTHDLPCIERLKTHHRSKPNLL